jgi:phospholipid/cholesterol/gamma-HCH transport system substrate-binding protein
MRRLTAIGCLICLGVTGLLATGASGDDEHAYFIEFDNAFGLTNGSEVKVAGVSAGTVTDLDVNSSKRAVVKVELSGPVAVLGRDTICRSEPQSLIAEYFIDCTPKGDPIAPPGLSDSERVEAPDIPVTQTRQTVQNDLVLSTLRLPFRERLTLLINEFGTALAGNGENLNKAIRRGAPALEQTRRVTRLLAGQNTMIRDLNANSDRIIGKLAARRRDVVRFIDEARNTAEVANSRRDDLSENFALLDDFLAQLGPTMSELDDLAVQGTPLAADLRAAAPGLTTLSRNLPDFNRSATDGLRALGNASVVGRRALQKGKDEVKQLAEASKKSYSVADNLSKFLRDIDDPGRAVEVDQRANQDTGRKGKTGYTGMEGLLNYLYYQTLAVNQYDEIGHILHFSIFEVATGPCANYNGGEFNGQPGVPSADAATATTDIRKANRCVAWLGRNQPGLNQSVDVPPYDGSVCPQGSTDLSICDPAGTLSAPASKRSGGQRAKAAGPGDGNGSRGGGSGAGGSGGAGSGPAAPTGPGGAPPNPAPGGSPTTPTAPTPPAQPESPGAPSGNGDLLDFLFGN